MNETNSKKNNLMALWIIQILIQKYRFQKFITFIMHGIQACSSGINQIVM